MFLHISTSPTLQKLIMKFTTNQVVYVNLGAVIFSKLSLLCNICIKLLLNN